MRQILKYEIKSEGQFTIVMPADSFVLTVQAQRNVPQIWVTGDPDKGIMVKRQFVVRMTGQYFDLSNTERYIGTFQLDGGSYVGHLFEV